MVPFVGYENKTVTVRYLSDQNYYIFSEYPQFLFGALTLPLSYTTHITVGGCCEERSGGSYEATGGQRKGAERAGANRLFWRFQRHGSPYV